MLYLIVIFDTKLKVLKMRVVSANGTILDLSPGKTVVHPKYPHETKQYIRWENRNTAENISSVQELLRQ